MNIQRLSVQNFRCFHTLDLSFDPQLSVVVGVNGAGKTSVLEATVIAIGTYLIAFGEKNNTNIRKTDAFQKFYPIGDGIDVQPQFPITVSATGVVDQIEVEWCRSLHQPKGRTTLTDAKKLTTISQKKQIAMMDGDNTLLLPLLCYYGTGRLWDYHRSRSRDTKQNNRANGYLGCLDGTANVKQMLSWFEKMTVNELLDEKRSPVFLAVKKAMEQCFSLMTGYDDVNVRYNYDTKEIDIIFTNKNKQQERKSIQYFSDGYKGTISLIADIAYRMALLNPTLGEDVLSKTEGVILIDEIDLHLHPAWQQRIIGDLTQIFPKIQFIVTTHAPTVINSVQSKNLIILEGLDVRPQNYQVYGKDVNSVLNEVMGVQERPAEIMRLFDKFHQELHDKDFEQAEKTLSTLKIKLGVHDPKVATCTLKLKLETMHGGK